MFQWLALAAIVAAQQVPTIAPGGIKAIGPKQDDPLTACGPGQSGPAGIIVQGGIEAIGPKQDDPRAPGSSLAIGPKQDDPRSPNAAVARPGDDEDPQARAQACEAIQR